MVCAVVPESLLPYEAHRASVVLNPKVFSYFTDVFGNRSAAPLLTGRILETEYVVLSFGAFLRVVQNGPVI